MNSIRGRLFLWLAGLVVCFVVLLIFLNSFFFKRYYLSLKERELIEVLEEISDVKTGSPRELKKLLNPVEDKHSLEIIIFDRYGNRLYSTNRHVPPLFKRPPGVRTIKTTQLPGGAVMTLERDKIVKLTGLFVRGKLDDKYEFIIHLRLSAMSMTVSILNRFSVITGSILLMLAVICSYYISGYLSSPIKDISRITEKMAELDFSEKAEIQGRDETGTLARNINVLSDSLHRAIDELNEKNRQLAKDIDEKNRLDEKRKELLRNVSHELKTPIALIMGYAEALRMNLSEDGKRREFYSEVVIDEAKRMNSLVEGLLNIHQIEFGDIKLDLKKIDLAGLMTDVYKKYDRIFKENKISFSIENTAEGYIYADPLMLESVCTNLINNSVSHMNEGKDLKISVYNKDKMIKVDIFNSSMPLADDELEKIWHSFYKSDRSRSRDKGGYGLGLSIVKAILDAHKFNFGVENVEKGILFWFEAESCS